MNSIKLKPVPLVATIFLLIAGGLIYSTQNRLEHLNPPLLKSEKQYVGKQVTVSGIAYPDSKIALYVDDRYVEETLVSNDGSFSATVTFDTAGENIVKAKQVYKNITSDFSEPLRFSVDLTPPDISGLQISSQIPSFTKDESLTITGSVRSDDKLMINQDVVELDSDGNFSHIQKLKNGENTIELKLLDVVGNIAATSTFIKVDNMPPVFGTGFMCKTKMQNEDDIVCLDIANWQGYLDSYNSMPITGFVKGDIKSIKLDGKPITWDENNEVYQRVRLYLNGGLNKYKVVVEDSYGNFATGYVTTDAERTNDSVDVNVFDY